MRALPLSAEPNRETDTTGASFIFLAMKIISFFFCIVTFGCCFAAALSSNYLDDLPSVQAFITINSEVFKSSGGKHVFRQLEVGWTGISNDNDEGYQISLYGEDPEENPKSAPLMVFKPEENPGNFSVTEIELPYVNSTEIGYTSKCVFPYWARVERASGGGAVSKSRCLRSEPSWMWENRSDLKNIELGELMLTATHDAAAYKKYSGKETLIDRTVWAQEESLQQQLQWGVRFLDLRVGYFPDSPELFWFMHGIGQTHHSVPDGLKDVAEFLQNSRDVVVLDFHTFEKKWNSEAHSRLQSLLNGTLGRWWVDPENGWSETVEGVWGRQGLPEGEGRIMAVYQDPSGDPLRFFPNFPEQWGNRDTRVKLKAFLDQTAAQVRGAPELFRPWRPNCQLTPNWIDIVFRGKSLRGMADSVNRYVTSWWRGEYSDVTAGAFTLHDYFLGSDMVRVAIEANVRRGRRRGDRRWN